MAAGSGGEPLGGLIGVSVAAAFFPCEGCEWLQIGYRPKFLDVVVTDVFGAHADGELRVHGGTDRLDVLWTDPDDVTRLMKAHVYAEYFFGVLEQVEAAGGHRGQ